MEGRRAESRVAGRGAAGSDAKAPDASSSRQVSPPPGRRESLGVKASNPGEKPLGKPYRSFPLTPHRSGQFCKKIRGKIYSFAKIDDPEGALRRYHDHCAGLHAGTIDRVDRAGDLSVGDLADQFLAVKDRKRQADDIEPATFVEYHRDCELMVQHFGRD